MAYNFKDIEIKWQKKWDEGKIYETDILSDKKKRYLLVEFPYPSGAGLHMGHMRSYTAMDVIARKSRADGFEVLFPIGWDAFGLPAENYAIKTGIHPSVTTRQNIDTFRRQLKECGFSFDWTREVDTTDPNFYRWSQWIFLKLYEKGLAYKKMTPVNWCPKDKCVLANEEVVDGKCERCGTEATKKDKEQWMLAITKYAERLDKDLDETDYLDKIKIQQRNWIGLSEGSEIDFGISLETLATFKFEDKLIDGILQKTKTSTRRLDAKGLKPGSVIALLKKDGTRFCYAKVKEVTSDTLSKLALVYEGSTSYSSQEERLTDYKKYYGNEVSQETIFFTIDFEIIPNSFTVFTTRADTLFGCTYCVLAPEHPLISELLEKSVIVNALEVSTYRDEAKKKLDIDRSAEGKEKTGVKLGGVTAVNPVNGEEVPVFIADYVLPQYGTGAIMAVPAHDQRDYAFAKKYNLAIKHVVAESKGYVLENAKEVEGSVIVAYDPTIRKFLKLINTKSNEAWLPGGGREEGETFEQAGVRELKEEAGFDSFSKLVELGSPILSYYYNNLKQSNRKSLGYSYLAFVDSKEQKELSLEEHEKYTTEWVTYEELYTAIQKTQGGVDHWLEILSRAKEVVDAAKSDKETLCITVSDGVLISSGEFNGLTSFEARRAITEKVGGKIVMKSKLRDWVFARQRYWGEPIPIVYDKEGEMYPVAESEFPIVLPQVDKYEPTDNGESPLSQVPSWVYVKGKLDEAGHFVSDESGEEFRRETDTMPQWAGSSWYFMRYIDPYNEKAIGDKELLAKWLPVDWYNGGMEHTTLHLLYSRFWYKFLFDIGLVPTSEPYFKRTSQGMILASDGGKMSKSVGNTVNPDELVGQFGADVVRTYEMFIGPFDQAVAWDDKAIVGVKRFLDKVELLSSKVTDGDLPLTALTHKTIKAVSEGIEAMSFNTCVSSLMIWQNEYEKEGVDKANFAVFLKLLSPFAPYLTEELFEKLGNTESIHKVAWPIFDESKLASSTVTISVQVNGKLRGTVIVKRDESEVVVLEEVQKEDYYARNIGDSTIKKVIFVSNKIINIVI